MGTALQWAKCLLLLSTISNTYSTGDGAEYRTTLLLDGLESEDNSTEIEENNYINFTVHIKDQNVSTIKISHQQNNLTVDLCKFSRKTTCEVSDSSNASSHCQCVNNHTVQFLKKASSSDSGLYTWTWRVGETPEKQRDIFITVVKGNSSDNTASTTTTAKVVCILLTVVVTAAAGVVLWMRNKAKCSIEVEVFGRYYRWRGSDHDKENQINGQTLSNGHHSTNYPNYANDNEQDAIHDPNYDDIKEQNKSQPLESSYNNINTEKRSDDSTYACVKKKCKSQLTVSTKHNVNRKDESQPTDPYYSDVKEPATSPDYDNNHTKCTEHDKSHNYDPDYADINKHKTSQPPDPDNSNTNQHLSHNCDRNYTEVKVDESSKPDDQNYAHVTKRIMKTGTRSNPTTSYTMKLKTK